MKRVMARLVAGVVVICLLTSPLAAYDRDITLPSTNPFEPISEYESNNGDDTGWDIPDRGTTIDKKKIRKDRIVYFNYQLSPLFVLHYLITKFFEDQIDGNVAGNPNGSDGIGATEENRTANSQ